MPTGADIEHNFLNLFGESISQALSTPTLKTAAGLTIDNPLYKAALYTRALEAEFAKGTLTFEQVVKALVPLTGQTAGAVNAVYEFFNGFFPTLPQTYFLVDPLLNPNGLGGGAWAGISQATRFELLAINYATGPSYQALFNIDYGSLSFEQAARKAYDAVIGNANALVAGINVDAAITYLVSQQNFFRQLGGTDLGAKAAMIGYLLNVAFETHLGPVYQGLVNHLPEIIVLQEYFVPRVGAPPPGGDAVP